MPQPKKGKETSVSLTSPPAQAGSVSFDLDTGASQKGITPDLQVLVSAIATSFTAAFNTCVDRIISAIEDKLTTKIDVQAVTVFDLNKRCERIEKLNSDMAAEIADLRDTNRSLVSKLELQAQAIDDLEQYSKCSNLLIHGIPVQSNTPGAVETNLDKRVVDYITTNLNVNITEADINAVHRLNKNTTNSTASNSNKPAPIIIQLCSRKMRAQILTNRKLLKGKGVLITEHLTAKKAQLLKKATDLVTLNKLNGAWAHDGKILGKTLTNRTITLNYSNISQF